MQLVDARSFRGVPRRCGLMVAVRTVCFLTVGMLTLCFLWRLGGVFSFGMCNYCIIVTWRESVGAFVAVRVSSFQCKLKMER